MGLSFLRTGCNQYTIQTGNTGATYEITISNINGGLSQSWSYIDNSNAIITFSIDGAYLLSVNSGTCVTIPIYAGGPPGNTFVEYIIPAMFVAPAYTGYVVSIVIATASVTYTFNYTILNTDTTILVLEQNIANYINGLSGVSAALLGGYLYINLGVGANMISSVMTICASSYLTTLWSTCSLWRCIQYLINKIFCCKRNKCEEHTKEMQKERNELNRIMLLYSQFSMMNDVERWDYLPLNLSTSIQDDLFDKLNRITARCGHCCKEYERRHHHWRENNFNSGCNECNPQPVTDWCQKLPIEAILITGPVIPIPS